MVRSSRGFTLVEMMIIAPVVILAIGAFIAAVVSMTGEVMSSRGANNITYELQDTLNRIEQDVKYSTTFLAQNSIPFSSSNPQGLGDGTVDFVNVGGPSGTVMILSALATNGNPLSEGVGNIYLNEPETCSSGNYNTNRPLVINIVYFVDDSDTLWRRTIMPTNYTSGLLCGGTVWQQPSCSPGWTHSYCKTDDVKLLEGVSRSDFKVQYFASALDEAAIEGAVNPSLSVAQRGAALNGAQSVNVTLESNKKIAGRDISRTGELRITRLDTNATSVAEIITPDLTGTSPTVSSKVVDGNDVVFEWSQLPGAETYTAQYKINNATNWTSVSGTFNNSSRSYKLTGAFHGDKVAFQVRGQVGSSGGYSAYGSEELTIPAWTPLPLMNGWNTYNNTYSPAAYTMTSSGMVMVRGMIKGGTATQGTAVANIPAKYRPSGTLLFSSSSYSTSHLRMDVNAAGDIIINAANASSTWLSLDTIRYVPDGRYTRYNATLDTTSPAFENYGGSFPPATYLKDSVGRVHIQGLVRYGSITAGRNIVSFPAAYAPQYHMRYPGGSSTYQTLGLKPNAIEARGDGSTGHMSLNINYLPSSHTSWTNLTLQNGWVRYSTTFNPPQFTKTADNVVNVRGLIKDGTTTSGTIIATLPANCRPQYRVMYSTSSNNAAARVEVSTDGAIRFTNGSAGWFSLDNLTFLASREGAC